MTDIQNNYFAILNKISTACRNNNTDVTLIAVSKKTSKGVSA
jgi:uncharacterized pyridoxal phosphate-containing UPF0001 family protein